MNRSTHFKKIAAGWVLGVLLSGNAWASDENYRIVREGLLGAGVGAISSYASGGSGGKGALIGAGTQVIGGALFNLLTQSPGQDHRQSYTSQSSYYSQPAPVYNYTPAPQPKPVQVQTVYVYRQDPVYIQQPQQQPVYYQVAPQEDYNRRIIKQGLLGAGVGAISSYASGGKGGRGALIGAGTNVIGGSLLEILLQGR